MPPNTLPAPGSTCESERQNHPGQIHGVPEDPPAQPVRAGDRHPERGLPARLVRPGRGEGGGQLRRAASGAGRHWGNLSSHRVVHARTDGALQEAEKTPSEIRHDCKHLNVLGFGRVNGWRNLA